MAVDLSEVLRLHGMYLRGESGGVYANLSEADIRGADICKADLRGADICGADLSEAIDGSIARLDFGGWSICVRSSTTSIGCQSHVNESWLAWSPESPEIAAMHDDAPEWWRVHGEAVKAVIRCVMAKAAREKKSIKS